MATATFDKQTYHSGEVGTLTIDYSDVPDGSLTFTAQIVPAGGGTPLNLSASAPIEADLRDPVVKVGANPRTVTRADDPANNRVVLTFTV